MSDISTYEYAVRQRTEGKWIVARVGLVALYVLFALSFLLLGVANGVKWQALVWLLPISTWLLFFVTWRYVNVEYEYAIVAGELSLFKIFGNRSRRKVTTLTLRDAAAIAPYTGAESDGKINAFAPTKAYFAISSKRAENVYYLLAERKARQGDKLSHERIVLYFEATDRAIETCRFYNPSATVRRTKGKQ